MKYFAYVIARDYGFAPNPFNGFCTLATCKPDIRKQAKIGDWIFGIGSQALNCRGTLIYAMQVSEKVSFQEYWDQARFSCKKPIMHGSLKTMYGDNIYHKNSNGGWQQEDSHHSLENGKINTLNLTKDTGSTDLVLIASVFYYFGEEYIPLPNAFISFVNKLSMGFKYMKQAEADEMLSLLNEREEGYFGDPIQFTKFQRYKGR